MVHIHVKSVDVYWVSLGLVAGGLISSALKSLLLTSWDSISQVLLGKFNELMGVGEGGGLTPWRGLGRHSPGLSRQ